MKKYFKINLNRILFFIFGTFFGLSILVYAGNYSSEEISYDNTKSGAETENVKEALDFLYNKTKLVVSTECPENMSCVEKPRVLMSVTGPGTVDKGTVYVGLNETNTFTVTPNNGYTLHNISCDNGYTLGSFETVTTSVQPSLQSQTITITNPGTQNGATCQIIFGSNEISVSSQQTEGNGYDICNNNSSGCICYQIKNNISDFTYGSHTGCNFTTKICKHTNDGSEFDCKDLGWNSYQLWGDGYIDATCYGTVTCIT